MGLVPGACAEPTATLAPPSTLALAATPEALPLISTLASAYDLPYLIHSSSSSRLLSDLTGSKLTAGFTYYLPPESALWSVPLALDGLVIVVHPANPVAALTLAQVRDIFTGRINDWSEVGGNSGGIEILSRETGSDLANAFESRALGGLPPALTALVAPGPQEMVEGVSRSPASIGYTSFGRLTTGVKAVTLEGVLPEPAAFENGTYPLLIPLLAVAPTEPAGAVRDFLIWIQSEEGQAVVGENYGRIK